MKHKWRRVQTNVLPRQSASRGRSPTESEAPDRDRLGHDTAERLQKRLADWGEGSRREIEGWIRNGLVTVDGRVATLGVRVTGRERIEVQGRLCRARAPQEERDLLLLMYHKPAGVVSTRRDPNGLPTVFDTLPPLQNQRWVQVGRLDLNTSGLLLFTNDGEWANRLMHPRAGLEREYAVRIYGQPSLDALRQLREGVTLQDGFAKFESIVEAGGEGKNHWYHVVLKEGRNREVRRLWESQGLKVSRLIRVRFGPVALTRDLRIGQHRLLTREEVQGLQSAVSGGSPSRTDRAPLRPARPSQKPLEKRGLKCHIKKARAAPGMPRRPV